MRLDLKGRRTAGAGAAAALALALYLSWPSPVPGSDVELVARPAPPPPVLSPPPALPPSAPTAPPPSAEGLILHGLAGGGAIIAFPEGTQRFVRIGRPVRPGLILREIRPRHALLESASGVIRLGFDGTQPGEAAPSRQAPTAASRPASRRQETLEYRLGLAPRRDGGRINGFTIRPGTDLPALRKAGLRPGDTILSVNGQPFRSEERVQDLAEEIATSYTAEFEFERNGRRMTASLQVNPE